MSLSHLTPVVNELPAVRSIAPRLRTSGAFLQLTDLPTAFRPALAAAVLSDLRWPALIVTSRVDRAEALGGQLNEYLPPATAAVTWPAQEALPYEQLPFDLGVATQRVALLDRLMTASEADGPAPILVTHARGLVQFVMPPSDLRDHRRTLRLLSAATLLLGALLAAALLVASPA